MTAPSPVTRVPLWQRQDAYGTVLALVVVSLVAEALQDGVPGATLLVVLVKTLTLVLVLRTTRDPVGSRWWDVVVVALAVVVGGPAAAREGTDLNLLLTSAVLAVVIALQIALVARRLVRHRRVTLSTAAGALTIYLLLGSFFAGVYGVLAAGTQEPLFASGTNGSSLDRLYFSFITLTTVGYGDLTPGSDLARVTVVLEALGGQLYLVTVVALVVGALRFGPGRE